MLNTFQFIVLCCDNRIIEMFENVLEIFKKERIREHQAQ